MPPIKPAPPAPLWVLGAFIGAIIGGAVVAFIGKSQWISTNITYTDLAAVLLAAVTLILTLFAFMLAAAAVYGYRELQAMIERRADDATHDYLQKNAAALLKRSADRALATPKDADSTFDDEDEAYRLAEEQARAAARGGV